MIDWKGFRTMMLVVVLAYVVLLTLRFTARNALDQRSINASNDYDDDGLYIDEDAAYKLLDLIAD